MPPASVIRRLVVSAFAVAISMLLMGSHSPFAAFLAILLWLLAAAACAGSLATERTSRRIFLMCLGVAGVILWGLVGVALMTYTIAQFAEFRCDRKFADRLVISLSSATILSACSQTMLFDAYVTPFFNELSRVGSIALSTSQKLVPTDEHLFSLIVCLTASILGSGKANAARRIFSGILSVAVCGISLAVDPVC